MSKCLIGLVIIDAPHSALNNAGSVAGYESETKVVVKSMQQGRDTYPYVSGQAWRNWWRTTLGEEFNWKLSPITREAKIAFTEASPAQYDDDDVFGYMRAPKKRASKKTKTSEPSVLTRTSPLKCSPLVAIEPQRPTDDWGVMARQQDSPVIHEHQFYGCPLKGAFSLDLKSVGRFTAFNRSGYQNIVPEYGQNMAEIGIVLEEKDGCWLLDYETRLRRVQQTIQVLPYLAGGASLTLHLTDVTPKLLLMSVIEGGNHPFMNVMVEENGKGDFSIEALREVIEDYEDRWLDKIYIGRRAGFKDELDESLKQLQESEDKVVYGSPNKVIDQLVSQLGQHVENSED